MFYGCNELESVTIPTIGFDLDTNYPNYYFGSLFGSGEPSEEASNPCVPASLKTVVVTGDGAVGYMAFANCNNIETIRFTGNPVSMASNIFSGCTSLKTVIVPYIGGGAVNGISGGTEELGIIYEWDLTPIANIKTNPSTTVKLGYAEGYSSGSTPLYNVGDIVLQINDGVAYICTASGYSDEWNECWYDWETYTGDTGYAIPHKENGYWYVGTTNTGFAVGSSYNSVQCGNGDPVTYNAYIDSSTWYQTPYVDMDTGDFYGITSHTYGNNGDLYYRTDENILYRKYNDAWHVENAFGNVTTGNNNPGLYDGDDGDRYINLTNGNVYYKDGGMWTLESNLKDQFSKFGYWFSAFTNIVGIPKSLKTIEITGNITEIKNDTFKGCATIEEFILPNSVTSIGNYAFAGCSSIVYFTIGDNINSIGKNAFENCTSLQKVIFPSGAPITTIQASTFQGCTSLEKVDLINSNIKTIGVNAFNGCTNLKSVLPPSSLETIQGSAFKNCTSLESFSVPMAVTGIYASAFEGCSSLKYVYFAQSTEILVIESKAFKNCTSLESIAFPSTYSSLVLGDAIFEGCTSLKSLTLKDLMNSFSYNQITGWSDADPTSADADINDTWFNTSTGDVFYVVNGNWELAFNVKPSSTSTIHHDDNPSNSLGNDGDVCLGSFNEVYYRIKANGVWSDKLYVGQYSIGYLFSTSGNNSLLPESLKTIVIASHLDETYAYSFKGCLYLETVVLPKNAAIVGAHAFEGCLRIENISLGDGVAVLDQAAFKNCSRLKTIELPASLIIVGQNAFDGCNWLTTVYFGGDSAKWTSITINSGNDNLTSASIKYGA